MRNPRSCRRNRLNPSNLHCSLSLDNVNGIWGLAQSTNCSTLIRACLPLLSTDIPRLLTLKLNIDQLREVLRLPSIKAIGGERQLRLVVNWMDSEVAAVAQITPVDQLDSLLPLVDLQSITDDILFNFIGENHAMLANHQYR